MKKLIFLLLIFGLCAKSFAQGVIKPVVIDLPYALLINGFSAGDGALYHKIKDEQDLLYANQQEIRERWNKILLMELQTQAYEKKKNKIMLDAQPKELIDTLVGIIKSNQQEMRRLARGNQSYLDFYNITDKELRQRAEKIKEYIEKSGQKEGKNARQTNAERNDLSYEIVEQLKDLKQVSQEALYTLQTVKKYEDLLKNKNSNYSLGDFPSFP